MNAKKRILCDSKQALPIAEAIAVELGAAILLCASGRCKLLRLVLRESSRADVLVLTAETVFNRMLSLVYRGLNSRGKVLLLTNSATTMLSHGGKRVTRLSPSLLQGAELSQWANTVLLPFMGYKPLATAWDEF